MRVTERRMTLARYLAGYLARHPSQPAEMTALVSAVASAVAAISGQARRGALAGVLGAAGARNVQDEPQQQLDVLSNELMLVHAAGSGALAAMVSEEMPALHAVPAAHRRGGYLLMFDPLDGSGNIDINMTVGTIFSVVPSPDPAGEPSPSHFLQPGTAQVCAGFALYGPSTLLVLTLGEGVDGFTLDPDEGGFVLTHPRLRIPATAREYAINASNERFWEPPVLRYVTECVAGRSGPRQADYNMRWVASLVADAFRILTRGGVFLYPKDSREPARPGRLRLLYECNPVAFIIEQAGGAASTGRGRIFERQPESLHQRVPFIFGSREEVERIEAYHRQAATAVPA
jgi:fructose-1,6-bisphosphatase I/sedoheptulose-1,7-bisphosphatase